MISLHAPFGFFPDPVGGTEVYVAELANALARQGHPAIVAAPATQDADYTYQGLSVRRFAASDRLSDVSQLYGGSDQDAARRFGRILDRDRPDIFHMHAFTRACSVGLVREAKARNIPVVFTYHTPTVSCQRGTLLEFGAEPCDGRVEVARCAGCTLDGLGVSPVASRVLGQMPTSMGHMLEAAGLRGGGWTALRMSSLIDQRRQALAALFSLADRIVALTPWVRDLLKRNDVPDSKIVVLPHGIRSQAAQPLRPAKRRSGRVRVAHLGRLDPVKGTGLLIRAMRLIPDAPIDLDVFGIVQGSGDVEVRRQLQRLAEGDPRVTFHDAIEHSTVIERLAGYDLVAVPSQWLETGPLVVLEAFAAGVPVLGSALGGLLDKVKDGVDGLLIRPYDSVEAWAAALRRSVGENGLLARLRSGVERPRSMDDVADEMVSLYRNLVPEAAGRVAGFGVAASAAIH
jgi:glycosyltransferase involved in cell wall biosynthesis